MVHVTKTITAFEFRFPREYRALKTLEQNGLNQQLYLIADICFPIFNCSFGNMYWLKILYVI